MDSYKNRIDRFANALALALCDKKIEFNGIPILFFLDADVVINLVLGFYGNTDIIWSSRQNIVRSLFSIGYFGSFYILRPHAFEFYQKLQTQPRFSSIDDRELLRARALDYIGTTEIGGILQELDNIILGNYLKPDIAPGEKLNDFLNVLREKPLETFSYVEHMNGTWPQRLRRVFDKELLKLDYLGPEISDLVINNRNVLYKFNSILTRGRPKFTINTFKDASALTILNTYINNWEKQDKKFIARFYTETVPLIDTLNDDNEIQDLLTYKTNPLENIYSPKLNIIHRNIDYFLMRVMFYELAPKYELESVEQLEPLEKLLSKLHEFLEEDDEYIEQALNYDALNGITLVSLLDNFERISIMDKVWIERGISDLLGNPDVMDHDELLGWTNIFKFAKGAATILEAEINDIRNKLEKHVSHINTWTKNFKTIIQSREKRISYLNEIEDPMRDLGLIRWNYDLSADDKIIVGENIRALVDDPDITITASEIATKIEIARNKVRECRNVCAILWALGRYNDINEIIEDCHRKNPRNFPQTLSILQLAARMRGEKYSPGKEKTRAINKLSIILLNSSSAIRKNILLGAGYIYYHAWRQITVKASIKERLLINQSDEASDYAKKAFDLGEEAYSSLPEYSLAWAYAVNHCTYVGLVTGIEPDKTLKFLQILTKLKNYANIWCARFDDTVGYYFLDHAEKAWFLRSDEQKSIIDITGDIIEATDYFSDAKKRDPGDIDIDEHLNRLRILSDSYQDFKLKNK